VLHKLLYAACLAPAPHHTRPWRFVVIETDDARARLIDGMAAAWRIDLEGDGVAAAKIEVLLMRSRRQLDEAPTLALGCLVDEGLRKWPDERRGQAEWSMAVQSMGCALENLMVAAQNEGIASFWISAPLFCQEAVGDALDLPKGWRAQALVALGYPEEGAEARPRPEPDLPELIVSR
jgi:coenzyme F420-0:L-glutamate ligase/coenzyme F420-1:gamma-L-glutamate ligase